MEREKEKKEHKRWYYTTGGKAFRGFLCMVTFAAFMAGFMFTMMAEMNFGGTVFSINPPVYYDTTFYSSDLTTEYASLIYSIASIEEGDENNTLRVIDTSKNQIRSFDLKRIEEDSMSEEGYPIDMSGLEEYETNVENKGLPFYNYSWTMEKLETESKADSYLYFSRQGFKELFMKCGLLNTNHRYSDKFSEGAYFVFNDTDAMGSKNSEELQITVSGPIENVNIEKTESAETKDLEYAVYDPVEDLYFSTWDEYFDPYDCYVYNCSQLLSKIEEYTEGDSSKLSNIVLPLLWSENLSVENMVYKEAQEINYVENAKEDLEYLENDAFLYYVECGSNVYKNVERIEDIASQSLSYFVGKGNKKEGAVKVQDSVKNLSGHEESGYFETCLDENFENKNVAVYFAIDQDSIVEPERFYYRLRARYNLYKIVAAYGFPVLVLTIVAFILLMVQAVSLIATTGRGGKKDKETDANMEVQLYSYDKLPTEIWFIVTLAVLVITGMLAGVCMIDCIEEGTQIERAFIVAAASVPFGFCFMILTLSFARRIKAKNFADHIYAGKIYRWCRKKAGLACRKCAGFYYKKNGAERLWFLFSCCICGLLLFIMMLVVFLYYNLWELGFIVIMVILVLIISAVITMRRIYKDIKQITACVENITKGDLNSKCEINRQGSFFMELADGVNHIGDGLKAAVETSLKDERMKTELITNVSHDLKTPLTSIINYVDLLKKEEMKSEDAKHYLEVLEAKSQRLKQLTEDLVEAAKANSGNIELECMPLAFDELMRQAVGEFEDKFASRNLTVVAAYPEEPAIIMADGRRLYRIIENVLQNAYKYALEGTRIYADLKKDGGVVAFTLKNVSAAQLNISPEELMERFTRGDSSRTTEGSGLGLSIAKDLTRLMEGNFEIQLDGDLFKVIVTFPEYEK